MVGHAANLALISLDNVRDRKAHTYHDDEAREVAQSVTLPLLKALAEVDRLVTPE